MAPQPPNERRWTMVASILLAAFLTLGGVVVASIQIQSTVGDGPRCGTAFFHDDPVPCGGAATPYLLISLAFFLLAAAAIVRLVIVARRGPT